VHLMAPANLHNDYAQVRGTDEILAALRAG
jgi:hypothetical protein